MSSRKKYAWSADGKDLPDIPTYAKAKHLVLQEYVKNWIKVIGGHCKYGPGKFTLVDGFCGGGMYRDGNEFWEGSSIRMIRMFEEGLATIQDRKEYYKPDVKFIFIDNNIEHTECLKLQLKNAGLEHYLTSGKCQIITNKFSDELDNCLQEAKKGYSFFFLDPFGLIEPATVREILSLGRSEVLLVHMLSGLVRLITRREEAQYQKFFHDLDADDYYREIADQKDFLQRQAYLRNQGLLLYRQEGNAAYAWTFAIMKNVKTVEYYLIHLSSNKTALEVMKETLFHYNNLEYQYHYGVYGFGFREMEYFANNLSIYNINEINIEICLNDLTEQLMEIIYSYEEGIRFDKLYLETMQTNAALKHFYMQVLFQQRIEKDIKVFREGRLTDANNLRETDLIVKAGDKPIWIPGLEVIKSNHLNGKKAGREKTRSKKGTNNISIQQDLLF